MPKKTIETPTQLVDELFKLLPSLAKDWDGGESFGHDGKNFTFHTVFLELAPHVAKYLTEATTSQLQSFCDILNLMVETGGHQENAASTCLLEHSSQIGILKLIKPFLSKKACQELH